MFKCRQSLWFKCIEYYPIGKEMMVRGMGGGENPEVSWALKCANRNAFCENRSKINNMILTCKGSNNNKRKVNPCIFL